MKWTVGHFEAHLSPGYCVSADHVCFFDDKASGKFYSVKLTLNSHWIDFVKLFKIPFQDTDQKMPYVVLFFPA